MTVISTQLLKVLRPEIEAALAEIGIKHGVSLRCANAKYSSLDFTFQLKGEVIDAGGGKSKAEAEWEKDSRIFGLESISFGDTFSSNGKQFSITGLDFNKRKYPILAKDASGGGYKFSVEAIKRHFNIAA